jgi:GT2 family glycosyltransferase
VKTAPKVSVITPTYNRADLISRSIDSVLAQHYDNFELIVIDDGSTDHTQDVLACYHDRRIKTVRFDQNRGIGAARHEGVLQAIGEWVAFLDADDLWDPEKLTCDLAVLKKYPEIDLLFDNYRNLNFLNKIDQPGFEQTRPAFERISTTELETGVFRIDSGLAEAMLTANLIGTASVITIRRSVFTGIGNFNPALSGPEDFELLWRAALSGVKFAYQVRILVHRHKNADSITAQMYSFAPRLLAALDICESSIYHYDRSDLLVQLNRARGRIWLSWLHACALEGKRMDAWLAFRNNLRYGITLDAHIYLMAALAGPHVIAWVRQFLSKNGR